VDVNHGLFVVPQPDRLAGPPPNAVDDRVDLAGAGTGDPRLPLREPADGDPRQEEQDEGAEETDQAAQRCLRASLERRLRRAREPADGSHELARILGTVAHRGFDHVERKV
jgi:hypothetical protein